MPIIKKHEDGSLGHNLKPIPSYYDAQLRKSKEKELARDIKLKGVFLEGLKYFNENYPKSTKNLKWEEPRKTLKFDEKKQLKENLEGFNEEELNIGWLIVQYNIKEHNYQKIDNLRSYEEIHDKFVKLIPGGKYLKEEYRLKDDMDSAERRLKEIQEIRAKERKKLENKLLEKKEIKPENETDENKFICECGKECTTKSALTNHKKSHQS